MGAFDAVMWGVEEDPLLRSVITLVVGLDKAPDRDIVHDRVERMSLATPKLRQRAIGNPFSLIPPRWEVDPNFDLGYHLRFGRVPGKSPGMAEVLELAETISEQDFDRARPLWELHVITGLKGGVAAFIIKIHHSITDGVGGMQMAASILDFAPDADTDLGPLPDPPTPHPLDAVDRLEEGVSAGVHEMYEDTRGVARGVTRLVGQALHDPMGAAVATQEWAASAGRMLAPASEPLSDLWTERSLSVSFSVVEVGLDDLKRSGKAVGGTLNDAFLAAVTGAMMKYHAAHSSSSTSLRVNMPINLRSTAEQATGGNRWVPARFPIPITVTDPAERMRQLHPLLKQAREEPALGLSDSVFKLLTVLPRPVTTGIAGGMMKGTDFAATNVPGPPIPVYFGGAQVTAMIPFAPKGGAAVNFALMSYFGRVFIGVNIDRGSVESPDELHECLVESLEEVIAVGDSAPN